VTILQTAERLNSRGFNPQKHMTSTAYTPSVLLICDETISGRLYSDLRYESTSFDGTFCRAMLCKRGLCRHAVSVCLSLCVCLSRSFILSKRINVSSKFFHHLVAKLF